MARLATHRQVVMPGRHRMQMSLTQWVRHMCPRMNVDQLERRHQDIHKKLKRDAGLLSFGSPE